VVLVLHVKGNIAKPKEPPMVAGAPAQLVFHQDNIAGVVPPGYFQRRGVQGFKTFLNLDK
jgi:hypothetical protein